MKRFALFAGALALLQPAAHGAEPECVVLLHGVLAHGAFMKPLESALKDAGYRTVNISYPSRDQTIEEIAAEFLPRELAKHDLARAQKVHFVVHSMGGLITRAYLAKSRPANLGRVVMLGTPNHGSEAADRLAESDILRKIVGVNLAGLRTKENGAAGKLGRADYDLGIIAGDTSINPLFSSWVKGEADGPVSLDSAKLEGMRDFVIVPYSHTAMLWRSETAKQVLAFLRDGKFAHPESE
jgi:pimeloyl-ACP methyl ester carboxylesterase